MAKDKNKDVKKKVAPESKKSVSKTTTVKKKASNKTTEKRVKVIQVKSAIGVPGDQKRTLVGLKLNKINRVAILEDTDSVRGMINKVGHLVKVEKL
jgi:large subunit ribosomal protein L30